jgi:hypothetical protein
MDEEIKKFIVERRKKVGETGDCSICKKSCCYQSGFGLFENTLKIYDLYSKNELKREKYIFVNGLSYCDFIKKYFDIVVYNNTFAVFYPRSINIDGRLIVIPPFGNFYNNRDYILNNDISINNKGCIFLSDHLNLDGSNPRCILHNNKMNDEITEKPIDCIFLNCSISRDVIPPTNDESNYWFSMLNLYYPNSLARFKQICPNG